MFVNLDGTWDLECAFVLGYRFTDDASDRWTGRFNAFKAGDERAVRAGIAVMRAATKAAIPSPKGPAVVIGVPGSAERRIGAGKPVACLAAALASSRNATLDLALIEKEPHAPLHTKYTTAERQQLLDGAKHRATRVHKNVHNYVLVDDLFTRGDTIERIVRAIRIGVPESRFTAVALAKTERREYWRARNRELDNSEADAFEQLWVDNYK